MLERLIALAICTVAALAPASAAATPRSQTCTRGLTTVRFDPRALLPLTGSDAIARAARAAMRLERPSSRPLLASARLATADRWRGPEAKYACGARVWRRTVVVYVTDRAMLPAQSASERVYFVGRVASGYRVWQVVH
jgi:hypothetical protein